MGFTTSLLSGFTLTATTLYLTLLYHQRSRTHQASLLHQQALLLNSLTDPALASDLATQADANFSGGLREGIRDLRLEKGDWAERWKDGWNRELEAGVRWCQGVRAGAVREGVEERWREWRAGDRRV